jgi:hypothetical protein
MARGVAAHQEVFGLGGGVDYASGAGDEVQEIRLGAVQSEAPV